MTVSNTPTPGSADDPLDGIHIIDCDAHFTEPADLWSSRTPANADYRIPVHKTVDGNTGWYIGDELWASTGGNTIQRGREKILGSHVVQPFEEIDESAWSVKARLELMDQMGIHAQVIYPNGVGFASNHLFAIEDDRERTMITKTYNDFFADIQEESGNRLLPQAMLPIWDMDLCIEEMTRLLDRGIRGFTLSDKPEMLGLPELPEPYFDPMWDLFNESGAVANFHIGAGARREELEAIRRPREQVAAEEAQQKATSQPTQVMWWWRSMGSQRRLAIQATQMYMSNVRIITNLCMSNLFDRYPKLQIVSAESGIGWVPFVLEAMEYQFDEMVTYEHELALTKRRPKEYFADHIYVMFWFEQVGAAKLIPDIGPDRVLVETDVPHPTCLFPNPREHFARVLEPVGADIRRRVLQDNAAELYKLELPVTA
jgi:predicted TIM-barrel fold metal-dependent hydrolase